MNITRTDQSPRLSGAKKEPSKPSKPPGETWWGSSNYMLNDDHWAPSKVAFRAVKGAFVGFLSDYLVKSPDMTHKILQPTLLGMGVSATSTAGAGFLTGQMVPDEKARPGRSYTDAAFGGAVGGLFIGAGGVLTAGVTTLAATLGAGPVVGAGLGAVLGAVGAGEWLATEGLVALVSQDS